MVNHPNRSRTLLSVLWAELTDRPLDTLSVMQQDARGGVPAGLAQGYWFADTGAGGVERMKVGRPLGGNDCCQERWTVYLDSRVVAELRDDAAGYALHVSV